MWTVCRGSGRSAQGHGDRLLPLALGAPVSHPHRISSSLSKSDQFILIISHMQGLHVFKLVQPAS
jgi:hypothetical protein